MDKPDSNEEGLTAAQQEYERFFHAVQSLMLATLNEDDTPLASYAPFAVDDDRQFYIYISDLAHHTANILRTGQVSMMLIEDETNAGQLFARKRLTFQCQATQLERDSAAWQTAAALYQSRFGSFFEMIRSLTDFRMFKLTPTAGWFVLGFGQAYEIEGDNLDRLTHRRRS